MTVLSVLTISTMMTISTLRINYDDLGDHYDVDHDDHLDQDDHLDNDAHCRVNSLGIGIGIGGYLTKCAHIATLISLNSNIMNDSVCHL